MVRGVVPRVAAPGAGAVVVSDCMRGLRIAPGPVADRTDHELGLDDPSGQLRHDPDQTGHLRDRVGGYQDEGEPAKLIDLLEVGVAPFAPARGVELLGDGAAVVGLVIDPVASCRTCPWCAA